MMMDLLDATRLEISPRLDAKRRAKLGQYMTPGRIAIDMAAMLGPLEGDVRLLDAGAGIGALTAAVVQHACSSSTRPSSVDCTCFEIDDVLAAELEVSLERCAAMCRERGIPFRYRIVREDYVLASAEPLLSEGRTFTHAILNPPYAKIQSASRWRSALRSVGIETVNLYAAFVAVAVTQLERGGQLVAITPRSFCNGPYYKPFRLHLLRETAIEAFHLFESRRTAFKDDDVLQENVVFKLRKGANQDRVLVSSDGSEATPVPFERVVQPQDADCFIRLGADAAADGSYAKPWPFKATLKELGLTVSTGRVVDFRARDHLRAELSTGTVPLIYPGHFDGASVAWPKPGFKKANALVDCAETRGLMVPEGTYVLTKRFSAKEERRRLVAAVYDGPEAGFENHLNYFHRQGGGIDPQLARGLAVFLNSTAADRHFREFSGHTQVNATDLRNMRYPEEQILREWGAIEAIGQDAVDAAIDAR